LLLVSFGPSFLFASKDPYMEDMMMDAAFENTIRGSSCVDSPGEPCNKWACQGYCTHKTEKDRKWMHANCCASCRKPRISNCRKISSSCVDSPGEPCYKWACQGYCTHKTERDRKWMQANCCDSCRKPLKSICRKPRPFKFGSRCVDTPNERCHHYACQGYCTGKTEKDQEWMEKNCCAACRKPNCRKPRPFRFAANCVDTPNERCNHYACQGYCTERTEIEQEWMEAKCCASCRNPKCA